MARTRRTRELRIGFDLDGPCYDFLGSISKYLTMHGVDAPMDKWENNWHGYRGWGLTPEEFRSWCDKATDEGFMFYDSPPEPGAVEATHMLAEAGHTIHVVTARDYGSIGAAQRNTIRWMEEYGFVFHSLTFDPDKTVVPTHLFIEDNVGNYDALHAAGTEAWLIDKWFNKDEPGRRRRRVGSTLEFAQMIIDRTATPGIGTHGIP